MKVNVLKYKNYIINHANQNYLIVNHSSLKKKVYSNILFYDRYISITIKIYKIKYNQKDIELYFLYSSF